MRNKKNPNKFPWNGKIPEKSELVCGVAVKIPDQNNQEQRQESMIDRKTPPQSVLPVTMKEICVKPLAYVPQPPRSFGPNRIPNNIISEICKTDTIYFSIDEENSTICLYGRVEKMPYFVFERISNLVARKVIEIVDRNQKYGIASYVKAFFEAGICTKRIHFNSRKGQLIFSSDFIPKGDCKMIIVRQVVKEIVDDENKKRKFVN